jgi:putative spermidine/putrescine transport system permease protein
MSELTISTGRPEMIKFTLPMVGGMGLILGFLTGNVLGNPLLGLLVGAVIGVVVGYVLNTMVPKKSVGRWAVIALFGVVGMLFGGLGGLVGGAIIGAILSWFAYWIGRGRYRDGVPIYYTPGQTLWWNFFLFLAGAIFVFLITPILVVLPLSFNAEDFFTFTPEMLRLDPEGYSLKHYRDFFQSDGWQLALKNSLIIAPIATIISVSLGTLAAIGLSQSHVPFKRPIMAILISPMIVPLIISATGMFFFYSTLVLLIGI